MRKKDFTKIFTFLMLFTLFLCFISLDVQANKQENTNDSFESTASFALVNLGLMTGDGKGNLNLENSITRCEFITLINRMMGYEIEERDSMTTTLPFKDISPKHWAFNNIITALNYNLITGYVDNTIRPDSNISFVEASALAIRALKYDSKITKKWPDGIIDEAKNLGLNKNLKFEEDRLLTRGEASILIYNALTVKFNE
jgi:hypothetical protein